MAGYLVRRAKASDIPAIMELLKQVNRIHYEGRPDLFKKTTKYTEDELADIIDDDDSPVFVCESSKGKILGHGFCAFERPKNIRLLNNILTLYIDDICVDGSVRGEKIGKAIYEHIVDYARQCDCYNVTLNVWNCNPGAIKFYESLGLMPYKIGLEKVL